MFRILGESSVSAGVRRIEAATSFGALRVFRDEGRVVSSLREQFKAKTEGILERVSSLAEQLKASEKLASDLRAKIAESRCTDLFREPVQAKMAVVANVQKDSGTIAVVVHAELAGGKGGGKPSLAQAGTKTPERIGDALREAEKLLYSLYGK